PTAASRTSTGVPKLDTSPVPVSVISVPTGPLFGLKSVIVGAGSVVPTTNPFGSVASSAFVLAVIDRAPNVAFAPIVTDAVRCVPSVTVTVFTVTPSGICTVVVPCTNVVFCPVIVVLNVAPGAPPFGDADIRIGAVADNNWLNPARTR